MNEITNTQLTLTSTSSDDEFNITQVISAGFGPVGVTVTMISITDHFNYETIGDVSTVTAVPMTWFEFPDMARANFTIRPYDENLDNGVPIYVPPALPVSEVSYLSS